MTIPHSKSMSSSVTFYCHYLSMEIAWLCAANLPREGRSPKLTDQARRALIREATKRQNITLKELQSSAVEIGVSVHRTTLSRTLHRAGL